MTSLRDIRDRAEKMATELRDGRLQVTGTVEQINALLKRHRDAAALIDTLSAENAKMREALGYMKARIEASLHDCQNAIQHAHMLDDGPALHRAKATGIDLERMLERVNRALAPAAGEG